MEEKDEPLKLGQSENAIRQACEQIAMDFIPKVKEAIDLLLEVKPYQGVVAWEKIASFAAAKKSDNKQLNQNPETNITINMIPAEREGDKTLDIPLSDHEIIDD